MSGSLISVRALSKSFSGPGGRQAPVLADVSLEVSEGEFVALLGRSGSGKSTLLRCIAGLIAPSGGEVLFRGKPLVSCNRDTAMVFQTFALLPWLTVQQNVEIGLEARGVTPAERAERALRAIDLVGLDGYESAYPKELSGGMRQRVGFARALVVEPAALLMDEPFSALDVLTSENLRGELLELWEGQRFPTKTMLMVTHNIEEAVLLADRILVLAANPGRIRADMRNPLPRPRHRRTPEFEALVDQIYRMMTQRAEVPAASPAPPVGAVSGTLGDSPLPRASVDGLSGLAEILHGRHEGAADLADLADSLGLAVDDLLPLVDALLLLGFAELRGDVLALSPSGQIFAGASIQDSKEIFARASLERAPLVRTIFRALRGSAWPGAGTGRLRDTDITARRRVHHAAGRAGRRARGIRGRARGHRTAAGPRHRSTRRRPPSHPARTRVQSRRRSPRPARGRPAEAEPRSAGPVTPSRLCAGRRTVPPETAVAKRNGTARAAASGWLAGAARRPGPARARESRHRP